MYRINDNTTPYIECSLSKYDDYYICTANIYNIPNQSEIIFSAVKDKEVVSFQIFDYSKSTEEFLVFRDFDSIIILAMDRSNKLTPIIAVNGVCKDTLK